MSSFFLCVAAGDISGAVPLDLVNTFLAEQRRTLHAKERAVHTQMEGSAGSLVSEAEVWLTVVLQHTISVRLKRWIV